MVKEWAESFSSDPSLGVMTETYNALKAQGFSVDPPTRPQKREITDTDRRREEEELQIALAMSLQETKISNIGPRSNSEQHSRRNEIDQGPNEYTLPSSNHDTAYMLPTVSQSQVQSYQPAQQLQQAPVEERTAATVSRCRALYDFVASEAGELTFKRGDIITVIESAYKDWWRGSLHGTIGIFPTNYVENLPEPTAADLQREAEDERKVFAEAKNVEKLLSILSSAELNDPSLAENEQLQNLYHSTISIRPKLVRLIEKYAQKKDDLISLNEKFMKARRDYDMLMEASLARYNTSQTYAPRPTYKTRRPSSQRPIGTGTQSQDNYQRSPQAYPNQQWPADRQSANQNSQQYHSDVDQFRSSSNSRASAPNQNHQYNTTEHNYPNRTADVGGNPLRRSDTSPTHFTSSHSRPTSVGDVRQERSHVQRAQNVAPTSPTQELAQAFSSHRAEEYPTPLPATGRSQQDGLPPISYYEEQRSTAQFPPFANTDARPRQQSFTRDSDPAAYYR